MKMFRVHPDRRANALILVVGVLVLLVLVTTAYLTRTQGSRVTAKAQMLASARSNSARFIGQSVADDIGLALFVKPELPTGGAPQGSANNRRRLPDIGEARWTHDPNNPYNFASYAVIPWTNPPDDYNRVDDNGSGFLDDDIGPSNPLGGPSYGDARWLRDTEPQRADLRVDIAAGNLPAEWTDVDGTPDTFTHWRHLTNLSQSTNAWRPLRNISDIGGDGVMTDLDVPVEQWPSWRPTRGGQLATNIGFDLPIKVGDVLPDDNPEFWNRWFNWFTLEGWVNAQNNSDLLPINFLDLSDLDADGIQHEKGERLSDAFVRGTPRWMVERTLADTDGDGFTDSLWHLSPYEAGPDIRQVVAVSITDNSGKVNFNVGSRFHRLDDNNSGEGTRGHTPADIALVGQNAASGETVSNWRVGFLDTPANAPNWITYGEVDDPTTPRLTVAWDTDRWEDQEYASLLDELGAQVEGKTANYIFHDATINPYANLNDPWDNITSHYGRIWYWQISGRDPLNAHYGFRPYNLSDELELRITEGNNYQFIGSRFENSLNRVNANGDVGQQIIRSDYTDAHEASELRHQLTNSQLVFDNRRKMTLFSGTRNDLLPPWLRWEDRFWNRYDPDQSEGDLPSGDDLDPLEIDSYGSYDNPSSVWGQMFPIKIVLEALQAATLPGADPMTEFLRVTNNWRSQAASKVDLREYFGTFSFGDPWWESNSDGHLTISERLPLALLLAMTDAQESGEASMFDGSANGAWTGYARTVAGESDSSSVQNNGDLTDPYQQTRLMAAGLASNILAYRDNDYLLNLAVDPTEAVPDQDWRDHSLLPFNPLGSISMADLPLSAAVTPPVLGRQRDHDPEAIPIVYQNFPSTNGSVQMLGLEAQPFILETFIAHVHQAKVPEPFGACCLAGCDTESICEEVSEETCISLLGGLEFHPDTLCVDVVCPDLVSCWACCLPSGVCIELAGNHCTTLGGTYIDGSLCCEIECGGACCFDTDGDDLVGCQLLSEESCLEVGGEYKGLGTECVGTPCTPIGACCLPSGSCVDIREEAESTCVDLGGVFLAGRFCIDDPCGGACCLDSGQCTNVTISTCFEFNGTYQLGVVCADDPCGGGGNFFGACCLDSTDVSGSGVDQDSGSCVMVSANSCSNLNGTFFAGSECSDDICDGACCLPKGGCEEVSIRTCEDQLFGQFLGAGSTCASASCTPRGACCIDPDECVDITEDVCELLGGEYQGDEVFCDTDPCSGATTPQLGGCCIANSPPSDSGICEDLTAAMCAIVGGFYSGDAVLCASDPCGEGACCITHDPNIPTGSGDPDIPIGLCIEVNALVCWNMGGEYKGDGVLCSISPCDVGACCIGDPESRCDVMTEGLCLSFEDGVYAGDGIACVDGCTDPGPAVTGACCLAETGECFDISSVHCGQISGTYEGDGTVCIDDNCAITIKGACCLPASTCETLPEFTCDLYGGVYQGNGTVCNDSSCPTDGACCLGSGSCIEVVNESECTTLGGDYLGQSTRCSGSECVSGACCLPNGSCMDVWDSNFCEDVLEGTFNTGTTCSTEPCLVSGACCLGSGSCLDVVSTFDAVNNSIQTASSECHDLGGSYSDGQSCDEIVCGGACCFTSDNILFCEEITQELCEDELAGSFQGFGTQCTGEPCCDIFEGACCHIDGCLEITDELCTDLGGIFNGISSSCESSSCPTQACCLDNGTCEDLLVSTCGDLGGDSVVGSCSGSSGCGDVPDSSEIGACCIADVQICEVVRQSTCVADLGGSYQGDDTTCFDISCPASIEGACCLGADGCVTVPQEVCDTLSGTFQGAATNCCDGICDIGACCLTTGECEQVAINMCDALGGTYQGAGALCAGDPCVDLDEAACCLGDGFCISTNKTACLDLAGFFQGNGVVCATAPCNVGACCLSDGSCEQVTLSGCEDLLGDYDGEGTDCDTGSCPPAPLIVGACCLDTDECADVSQSACTQLGGLWSGEGVVCASDPCAASAEGACCLGGDPCVNVAQEVCLVLGGLYQGDGVLCNTSPCIKGACCLITFECAEVSGFTCSELGGEYQGDLSQCSDGLCCCTGGSSSAGRSEGACCLGVGECVEVTENTCLLLAGLYQGDDTLCAETTCVVGACCLESTSCMEVTEAFCIANGGLEYGGDGTLCCDGSIECFTEIGACCLATGQCKEVSQITCDDLSGSYWGDATSCSPDPCGLGACCVPSGSCLQVIDETACSLLNGEYQGDGSTCDASTCEPHYIVTPDLDDCPQETLAVVQLANPFDRPVDLRSYTLEFFGQRLNLSVLASNSNVPFWLPPATADNPATLIVYAMTDTDNLTIPKDDFAPAPNPLFRTDWLDFLDLDSVDHPSGTDGTIIVEVPEGTWSTTRDWYDGLSEGNQHAIALYKTDGTEFVLVDRLDRPTEVNSFSKRVVTDMENEWDKLDKADDSDDGFIDTEIIVADINDPDDVLFVQWDRATRAWGVDVPAWYGWHNGTYDSWERSPRFVFSARDFIRSLDAWKVLSSAEIEPYINHASIFNWTQAVDPDDYDGLGQIPDGNDDDALPEDDPDPWFRVQTWSPKADNEATTDGITAGGLRYRKPTYFDMNYQEGAFFPDKGWYGQARTVAIHDPEDGSWVPHSYADDGTTAANPAFLDFEFDPFDASAADGIGVNEAVGQDLDGDFVTGEAERDMAFPFPMQMLQKDGDFEQVGEVLNCWLFGHMLDSNLIFDPVINPNSNFQVRHGPLNGGDINSTGTLTTFSEFMYPKIIDSDGDGVGEDNDGDGNIDWDWWAPLTGLARHEVIDDVDTVGVDETRTEFYVDARVNRLRFDQGVVDDGDGTPANPSRIGLPMMVGGVHGYNAVTGTTYVEQYPWPRLSVAGRVLDSFVCDGPGRLGGDLQTTDTQWFSFFNANGFTGKATPGLININTATVEAMRALPHMNKIVHATQSNDSGGAVVGDVNPRSLVPESILQWREHGNGLANQNIGTGITGGPDYSNRTWRLGLGLNSVLEETRGLASPSQIGLLTASPFDSMETEFKPDDVMEPWHSADHQAIRDADAWRIDYAGLDPFSNRDGSHKTEFIGDGIGAPISTDINQRYYDEDTLIGDRVSGDSEELNMLQAGISNLITTTSDMFTVHMRIRTFKRDSITGVWDATKLDNIIDDSRYVMLVDRSHVNAPEDKPKILYFEKLPN